MLREIIGLEERIAEGGDWMQFRNEISALHDQATTQEEYAILLNAHSILGHLIEQVFDEVTAEKIRAAHSAEYKLFLNKEALENSERINPGLLAMITAREVEAGRMEPDDEFRRLAEAGGQLLGDPSYQDAKPARWGNWAAVMFLVLAVVLWAMSIRPFGLSALWLIVIGFVIGWFINEQKMKQIKHRAEVERAQRGY